MKAKIYSFEKARFRAALKAVEGQYHPDNREEGWTIQDGYQVGLYNDDGSPVRYQRLDSSPGENYQFERSVGVYAGLYELIRSKRGKKDD